MRHINVLGKKVKVVEKDLSQEHLCGKYTYEDCLIEIDISMNKEQKVQTLLHEVIHATLHRAGVKQTSISHDTEEIICDQVAKVISENFNITYKKYR